MKAIIKHLKNHAFLGKSETNHWLPIDNKNPITGDAAANNPVQMLLIASCACVSIDMVDILNKKRIIFSEFQMEAEAVRYDTAPKVFRSIEFHASLRATDPPSAVEGLKRSLELSLTKYCTVSLSLDRSVKFTARCTVVDEQGKILTVEPWEIPRDASIYERDN